MNPHKIIGEIVEGHCSRVVLKFAGETIGEAGIVPHGIANCIWSIRFDERRDLAGNGKLSVNRGSSNLQFLPRGESPGGLVTQELSYQRVVHGVTATLNSDMTDE